MPQISLSRLPWWGQIAAFLVVSGAALFGFWYYYVADVSAEMATREARLVQLRTDITRGLNTAKRLPEFQAQVDELERRLEALKTVLPDQKDYADILRRVQTLATQSNLAIRGFQPKPVETKQIHEEWPITLELDGTYHNLGMFFDRISKFPRIINVSALKIRAKDQPTLNSTISAECTATTFVLVDSSKAPPAKPGARPVPPRPGAPKTGP
ncbi:MAG: type 4a pilus biogenesis protein PilO [Vicinamibacterales bacterium]